MSPVSASRIPLDTPQSGRSQQTRQALVAATRQVIASGAHLHAGAVAQRAGLSTATFYGYFASRNGALVAAADQVLDELNVRVATILNVEHLLDVGLRAMSRELLAAVVAALRENAPTLRLARARLAEDADLRDAFRARERELLGILRRFVELGAAAGRVRQGDHAAIAAALLVTVQGYDNPVLLKLDPADAAAKELADIVERLLEPPGRTSNEGSS
jgi:AcrR family transcriptional regulator